MQLDGGLRTGYVIKRHLNTATSTDYNLIIRCTKILLNQIESLAHTNNNAQALLLSAVRNRSAAAADQYAAGALTGTSLVPAILNEQGIEFVDEGLC